MPPIAMSTAPVRLREGLRALAMRLAMALVVEAATAAAGASAGDVLTATLGQDVTVVAVNTVGDPILGPVGAELVVRRAGRPDQRLAARDGLIVADLRAIDLDGDRQSELVVGWTTLGTGRHLTPVVYGLTGGGALEVRYRLPAGAEPLLEGELEPLPGRGFRLSEAIAPHSFRKPYARRTTTYGPRGGRFEAVRIEVSPPQDPHQWLNGAGDLRARGDHRRARDAYVKSVAGLLEEGERGLAALALIEAARCSVALGDHARAVALLERVAREMPDTDQTHRARVALERLKTPRRRSP